MSLQAVLEQLFEDLNSYSETSIPLDGFNSLEIKLFPFYRESKPELLLTSANPPEVNDWDVPIPLVDFNALKDDYWDITASRVSQHINGIHHSAKIAQLADADLALTRETLRHMLFYQVIMMVCFTNRTCAHHRSTSFSTLTCTLSRPSFRDCAPTSLSLPSAERM